MAEVTDFEMLVTVLIGLVVGVLLVLTGIFPDGGTVIVFVSMVLIGFITVRVIRGRKNSWR